MNVSANSNPFPNTFRSSPPGDDRTGVNEGEALGRRGDRGGVRIGEDTKGDLARGEPGAERLGEEGGESVWSGTPWL